MMTGMKAVLASLAMVLVVVTGCATTQTAETGGEPASGYETDVMKAVKDIYPGQDLSEIKISPPSPVKDKEGVDGGVITFTVTRDVDIREYLYTYEIAEGNVSLERKVIKKK